MWLITNITNKQDILYQPIFEAKSFSLYGDSLFSFCEDSKTFSYSFGYVLPTDNASVKLKTLINKSKYGGLAKLDPEYRNYLKGNFTVVTAGEDWFSVDGDRFGVQKWFYWQNGKEFIVSDSLSAIRKIISPQTSIEAMAMYALTYHFTAGLTLFKEVFHNEPGQYVEFKNGTLDVDTYWDPLSLLDVEDKDIDIEDIVESLSNHVIDLLNFHGDRISLSLTGGADTRNILAIMLKNGVKPHLYTYGNPDSTDCRKAKAIADGLGLEHTVHDIQMTPELFSQYGEKIIGWGQSLSSIHRAHRIIAVEREAKKYDAMYLGTLGGEFVKGVSEDDYIVAAMVTDHWDAPPFIDELVDQRLRKKSFSIDENSLRTFTERLNAEPYFMGSIVRKKMASLTHITTHLHDAQDIVLYQYPMKHVFTPFMDYDYLHLLFSSRFPFNKKEVINNPIKRRVVNPVYASNFIRKAYPPLGKFKYSGEHTPDEVLVNPYYGAIRRELRKIGKKKDPANFPLGEWMESFVKSEMKNVEINKSISQSFNFKEIYGELSKNDYVPQESFWLKYTNPIFMDYILRFI